MNAISKSELWKKRLGDWVINPYIGCEHGCVFCYCPAMPGVKFFNQGHAQDEWGEYVIEKEAIVAALARQLRGFSPEKAILRGTCWGGGWVLLSFLTDCYQPIEAKTRTTRDCLKLLLESGHKVRIQTRSALVERDFDLLKAHRNQVLLGTSIPSLDERMTRALEPRASGVTRRLSTLAKAQGAGIPLYVAIAPVMPWTTKEALKELIERVDVYEPREVFCEVLNPKGSNLGMVAAALARAGFVWEVERLGNYDAADWARRTHEMLRTGWGWTQNFVPWPDTGRGWAKHLRADEAAWLEQFLPNRVNAELQTGDGERAGARPSEEASA